MSATATLARPATTTTPPRQQRPATISMPAPTVRRAHQNRRTRGESAARNRRRAGQCAFDAAVVRAELGGNAAVTFDPATLFDLADTSFEHYIVTGTVTSGSTVAAIILECDGSAAARRRRYTIVAP